MKTQQTIEAIDQLGLEFSAKLTKDDGPTGQSHWEITLVRNGQTATTSYHQGSAYRHDPFTKKPILYGERNYEKLHRSRPTRPKLADVLYCLVSDAQCVSCGQTFADFCCDLGYDDDSRTAYAAFQTCRETHYDLIRLGLDLDFLTTVFEDY